MEVHNSYFLLVRVFVPVPMFFGTACSRRESESEGEIEDKAVVYELCEGIAASFRKCQWNRVA